MAKTKAQTTSFVVRFTQKIYQDEKGETGVQWRGKISHVQGGDQMSFVDFKDGLQFMQEKLAELTEKSTEGQSPEEREGILMKSFEMWKKVASEGPKMVLEAIRDPAKQVAQIQDQISHVQEEISHKMDWNELRAASKSDFNRVMGAIEGLSQQVSALNDRMDDLDKS